MRERALVFGSAADAYEEHRLGYPDAVGDLTLAYAEPPVEAALEVGAGTGKATSLFASRGIAVDACEPDPGMAEVLRRTTAGLSVAVVLSTFEAYASAGKAYDLLFSASAWHWTDPATRWDRTAAVCDLVARWRCSVAPGRAPGWQTLPCRRRSSRCGAASSPMRHG